MPKRNYNAKEARDICKAIAEGACLGGKEGILRTGNPEGFPSRPTFYRWLVEQPELRAAYRAAREISAHILEEEALQMAREIRGDPGNAQRVRAFDVAMNQLRWSAGKRNPREYSERGQINFTVPIQIITSLDLGQPGAGGAHQGDVYSLAAQHAQDATVEEVDAQARPLLEKPKGERKKPGHINKHDMFAIANGLGDYTEEQRAAARQKVEQHYERERKRKRKARKAAEKREQVAGEATPDPLDGRGEQ